MAWRSGGGIGLPPGSKSDQTNQQPDSGHGRRGVIRLQRRPAKAKSWTVSASSPYANTLRHKSHLDLKKYLVQADHTVFDHSSPAALRVPHSSERLSAVGAGTHNCIFAAERSAKRNAQNGKWERENGRLPVRPRSHPGESATTSKWVGIIIILK